MKLIIGLGNPGKEYDETRHNIGFDVIDYLAKRFDVLSYSKNMNGFYCSFILNEEKVMLLKPQKFMNLSGEVIKDYINFYKIPIENILVIHDDLDLAFGKLRLRSNSSSGGHNGIKNIEQSLNTKDYKRLKIGIGNDKMFETKDYVLGKFTVEEKRQKEKILEMTFNICLDFLKIDFDDLMNKYN